MHFTPTGSSWINQVERRFGFLTDPLIRSGVHKSVQSLEKDIRDWIAQWNNNPRPSYGRRPQRRSSNPSHNIADEFQAQDTGAMTGNDHRVGRSSGHG